MGADAAPFAVIVKKVTSEAPDLLARIADALAETFIGDAALHASVAKLQRLGLAVVVRLELCTGDESPLILLEGSRGTVPEWSLEDGHLLRSLGIAADSHAPETTREPKPGRRQPR